MLLSEHLLNNNYGVFPPSMFFTDKEDSVLRNEKLRSHNPALMALYEIIHLNRNFITTLAHYQTESTIPE